MARVRIKNLPKAQSGLETKIKGLKAGLGFNANTMPWPVMAGQFSQPDIEVNHTLKPVPRDQANLEAEKDEVVLTQGAGGVPDHFIVGGKRHSEGGTPLKLPEDSFIYSDTKDMRIKDPTILKQFGISGNNYTPAEVAKKYDISKFKKVLADPDSDDLQRQTAEAMIKNYNLKLAKLALYQESIKGFPQGIPVVAMPYIMENQIDPSSFMGGQGQPSPDDNMPEHQFGGGTMMRNTIGKFPDEFFQTGGAHQETVDMVAKAISDGSFSTNSYYKDVYNNLGIDDKKKVLDKLNKKDNYTANFGPATTYRTTPTEVIPSKEVINPSLSSVMTYLRSVPPEGEFKYDTPTPIQKKDDSFAWNFSTPKQEQSVPEKKRVAVSYKPQTKKEEAPIVEVDEEF